MSKSIGRPAAGICQRNKILLKHLLSPRILGALLAAWSFHPQTAHADESYFMIVFAYQRNPGQLEFTHTFATFVKATGEGTDPAKYAIDSHTLSWMPRSLGIKFLNRPEEGVNLDLKESLQLAKAIKAEVTMWGPFRIQKELYQRAIRQEARLKKGNLDYKALDVRFRPHAAMNCIHAVADIDTDKGLLATGTASGRDASYMVLTHLSRWIIGPNEKHDWIGQRLELGKEIIRRDFRPKLE